MQTLGLREAYDRDEFGVNARIMLFVTVFLGAWMMGMIL